MLHAQIIGLQTKDEFDEIRQELLHCNTKLKEAWRAFTDNKQDLLPADKTYCFQTLSRAQELLDDAWSQLKQAQTQAYSARRAAREQQQREWEEKQRDFRERVSANIEKLEGKLVNARSALDRQESHLAKLESDYSNAWNDNYRDRCAEWITEAKDKIADIQDSIYRMESWLEEEREKLR